MKHSPKISPGGAVVTKMGEQRLAVVGSVIFNLEIGVGPTNAAGNDFEASAASPANLTQILTRSMRRRSMKFDPLHLLNALLLAEVIIHLLHTYPERVLLHWISPSCLALSTIFVRIGIRV